MGRSRTRKLRPRVPLFPFASNTPVATSSSVEDAEDMFSTSETNPKEEPSSPDLPPVNLPGSPPQETTQETAQFSHHDAVCFLKIIGSIQSGQKLSHSSSNPNQPFSIDPNMWSSSVSRWWNGDSRSITIKLLREKFENVFHNIDETYSLHINKPSNSCQQAFNRSPKDILLDYARELAVAEKGLRHLCHTYKRDVPIASELQVMLESVSIRKQTIDNMFTIRDD